MPEILGHTIDREFLLLCDASYVTLIQVLTAQGEKKYRVQRVIALFNGL